jgi:type 1 glutamine amidotransferase
MGWKVSRRALLCPLIALLLAANASPAEQAPIKLLTIGNSFAGNSTAYLAELAASAGVEITILPVNLGGCSLSRHARHLRAYKADPIDPEGRPYSDRANNPDKPNYSLVEALQSERWDVVTLQQFSADSYKPETYQPYATELIEAVRQHAPKAKILVHQTWAYRADHPFFADGELTQQKMFERLRAAYDELAEGYGLGMLPVAEAYQIARATPMWRFAFPDRDFNYERPPAGTLPDQTGSLIAGWAWRTNRETGVKRFTLDAKHANAAGRYLGASVFYEVLSSRSALDLSWRPEDLTKAQAASLRQAAHQAVAARQSASHVPSLRQQEPHPGHKKLTDAAIPVRAPAKPKRPRRILVSNRTVRDGQPDRSSSYTAIPIMNYAIKQMGKRTGAYEAVFSNDIEMLRPETIGQFDAICFANTVGVLFDDEELRKSLLNFVAEGKGFVGIHDAIATFVQYPIYDQWPAFGQMLGGTENGGHPWNGEIMTLKTDDPGSPLTAMFRGAEFKIADQAFQLQEPTFRDRIRVLLSIDVARTARAPKRRILPARQTDQDFPVSWVRPHGQGRVFFSGLGHGSDVFWNRTVLEHLLAGIQYALGDLEAGDQPVVR